MSHTRRNAIFYALYAAGGVLLTIMGPGLWGVPQAIATVASLAATLCFFGAHFIVDTRRVARFALTQARQRRAELVALGTFVAAIEVRLAEAAATPETITAAAPEVAAAEPDAPDVTNNLLQFAAHVSERCSGRSREGRSAPQVLHTVAQAVADARIEMHLQPIVRLPARQPAHYAALPRLRDASGRIIEPEQVLPAVDAAGIAAEFETQQLAGVISLCNRLGERQCGSRIFCNLSEGALASPEFRAELTGFMEMHPELAGRIVFELNGKTVSSLGVDAIADLRSLGAMGFRFSAEVSSLGELGKLAVYFDDLAYAKISVAELLDADPNVVAKAAKDGLQLIALGVETERQAVEMVELGIGLGQGMLFGMPRPARTNGESLRRAA